MSDIEPITTKEGLLDGKELEPDSRTEAFIKRIFDKNQPIPEPNTRIEYFLKKAGEGGGGATIEQLDVSENGTYSEEGKAYSPVVVDVQPNLQRIEMNITDNGMSSVSPSQGYDGLEEVALNVNVQPPLETKNIDDNGTYTPSSGIYGFSSVTVAVPKGSNANITLHCQGLGGGTVTITATNSGQTYTHTNSITTDDEDTTFSNLEYVGNWTVTNSKDSSTLTVNNSAVEADLKLLTPSIPKMISATLPKGEVSCSSSLDDNTYALFAVDKHMSDTGSQYYGNPNIGWLGNDGAPWIKYEFDEPVFFNKLYFRLHSRWDSTWATNRSYTWAVEGSNDDITYETVLANGDDTVTQYKSYNYWWIFDLALNGKKYKYLRLSTNHTMYSRDYWNENMLDLQLYSDPNAVEPITTGALTATENGTYDPEDYDLSAFSEVTVNVPNTLKGALERTASVIDDSAPESIGPYAFFNYKKADGSSENLASVKFENATSIGQLAFNGCKFLASADFPKVTSISSNVFSNCTSLTDINFPNTIDISDGVFSGCISLTNADFPKVTSIGQGAFYNCTSLTDINFPNTTSIGSNAFYGCTSLTDVDFPDATTIGAYTLQGCTSLTDINFPKVTSIGDNAFYGCTSLTDVDFPDATSIRSNAFYNCTSLTDINFPKVTGIWQGAFYGCTSLTDVDFPDVEGIGQQAFYNCTSLTEIDFSVLLRIGLSAFQNCSSLGILILRTSDAITNLANINAFNNTPFASGGTGGTLYVPQALISSYQSASNWSTILGYPNNQIKPIEGSIYE